MTAPTYPDGLEERHHRPPRIAKNVSLLSILVLAVFLGAAFFGLYGGGRATPLVANAPEAALRVHTPQTLRSGLFFETRITVAARRDLADATVTLPVGLWRDLTINTSIPAPEKEEAKDDAFRFHYGPLKAGERLELKFDGQINPPLFAGNRGEIALMDGERRIAAVPFTLRVLP